MILSVEDDRDTLELLEDIFKENGFENCKFFTDSNEAIKAIDADSWSIFILDYKLGGGITGLDVLKKARSINKNSYVIGFTGMRDLKVIRRWVNEGLNKWVDKNEQGYIGELVEYVREAIKNIKEDFDFHTELLKEITDFKTRRSESSFNR